jgi:hypothetical protein
MQLSEGNFDDQGCITSKDLPTSSNSRPASATALMFYATHKNHAKINAELENGANSDEHCNCARRFDAHIRTEPSVCPVRISMHADPSIGQLQTHGAELTPSRTSTSHTPEGKPLRPRWSTMVRQPAAPPISNTGTDSRFTAQHRTGSTCCSACTTPSRIRSMSTTDELMSESSVSIGSHPEASSSFTARETRVRVFVHVAAKNKTNECQTSVTDKQMGTRTVPSERREYWPGENLPSSQS